jgi:hypothetical protein
VARVPVSLDNFIPTPGCVSVTQSKLFGN